MRKWNLMLAVAVFVAPLPVLAQSAAPAAPAFKGIGSSAEVAALIAKLKAEHKGQPTTVARITGLAPAAANVEYRTGVGPANIHEKEGEFFYVIEGSGTLILGGTLKDEKRVNDANRSGTAIEGGTATTVSKGDFAVAPAGTAHWFSAINGTLILMSLHYPGP